MIRIGISLGDVTGIGPEVTLKALAGEAGDAEVEYRILGDRAQVESMNQKLGLAVKVRVEQPEHDPLPARLESGAAEAARAAVAWVKAGAQRCLKGELDALVTAPVNKQAIVRAGIPFIGQTELLSELAGTRRTAMMLLGQDERGEERKELRFEKKPWEINREE